MLDSVSAGREAFARFAWADALAAFSDAERHAPLDPDDLQMMAAAAWWNGEIDEAVDAYERAHGLLVREGRRNEAATVALRLGELAVRRFSPAVGNGWLTRAERLLEGEAESSAHARLVALKGMLAFVLKGDMVGAMTLVDRSLEIARRLGVLDVESLSLALKGQILARQGRWAEGIAALDEASAAAAAGQIDPKAACDVYCQTISSCSALGDYRRAAEWIDEADRWMRKRSINGYRGVCRVHRAELKRLGGQWAEAESEARLACDELTSWRLLDGVGLAHYEIGEVRLGMGDLQGAEAAFATSHEYGHMPQPGLALLHLAQGDVKQAARSIAQALPAHLDRAAGSTDLLALANLLPAQVEIALASEDLVTARMAAEELASIAANYDSDAIRAAALAAQGAVALASGANSDAVSTLEGAWRLWHELDVPYQSARVRLLLGHARLAAGDEATATLEFKAAKAVFERLGAARDLRLVSAILDRGGAVDQRRVSKTFLFSDIVTSTELVRLIGDSSWNDLIAWHDRLLREAFTEHNGVEVRHTGDGFFVTFDVAADAVNCAVAIQRRLKAHRREHGFAPLVRIGLHSAEASPHGSDYAGHGVHIAARVAAQAQGEELVASSATLDAAGPLDLPLSEPRLVKLKGVAEPVEIRSVAWE